MVRTEALLLDAAFRNGINVYFIDGTRKEMDAEFEQRSIDPQKLSPKEFDKLETEIREEIMTRKLNDAAQKEGEGRILSLMGQDHVPFFPGQAPVFGNISKLIDHLDGYRLTYQRILLDGHPLEWSYRGARIMQGMEPDSSVTPWAWHLGIEKSRFSVPLPEGRGILFHVPVEENTPIGKGITRLRNIIASFDRWPAFPGRQLLKETAVDMAVAINCIGYKEEADIKLLLAAKSLMNPVPPSENNLRGPMFCDGMPVEKFVERYHRKHGITPG